MMDWYEKFMSQFKNGGLVDPVARGRQPSDKELDEMEPDLKAPESEGFNMGVGRTAYDDQMITAEINSGFNSNS